MDNTEHREERRREEERRSVDEEFDRKTSAERNEYSSDKGADAQCRHAGYGELRVGVNEHVVVDDRGHQGLESGVEEHRQRSDDECDAEYEPPGTRTVGCCERKPREHRSSGKVDSHERPAKVSPAVKDHTGDKPKEEHWQRLCRRGEAKVEWIGRERKHEIGEREERDVVAEQGNRLSTDEGEHVAASSPAPCDSEGIVEGVVAALVRVHGGAPWYPTWLRERDCHRCD